MAENEYVALVELCECYQVEYHFFEDLQKVGLVEIINIDQDHYLPIELIDRVEKIVRLHQDLRVNIEGIDVVMNLLQKMDALQEELNEMRNRLGIYER